MNIADKVKGKDGDLFYIVKQNKRLFFVLFHNNIFLLDDKNTRLISCSTKILPILIKDDKIENNYEKYINKKGLEYFKILPLKEQIDVFLGVEKNN